MQHRASHSERFRCRSLAPALAIVFAGLTWLGCSMERHYHILSRFFDGVPDPSIVQAGSDAVAMARLTGGVYYTHEPYAQEQCESCHASMSGQIGLAFARVESTACLNCHADVKTEHAFMHGPVVAGACLFCHAPHESTVKPLLRVSPQRLCMQCHGTSLAQRPAGKEIPEHSDPERSCLDCHYGHGGESRAYLRQGALASFQRRR